MPPLKEPADGSPGAIDRLTREFARLPGIGRKTALRLTYHLLKQPEDEVKRLALALGAVAEGIQPCGTCGNPTDRKQCAVCSDSRRDGRIICVVEEPSDIAAIERTGGFRGLYHVLGGRLSPLDGIGPDDLNIAGLLERLDEGADTREVILATNPSVEGEATAVYLQKLIRPLGVRLTRLARGLPVGSDLEYADGVTIAEAFAGRTEIGSDGGRVEDVDRNEGTMVEQGSRGNR